MGFVAFMVRTFGVVGGVFETDGGGVTRGIFFS